MRNAAVEGTLHLPSHNLALPLQQSFYCWEQRIDHRGRPRSKVQFGSFEVEILADQAQVTALTELAADSYAVVDGYATFMRADGQGTFVNVWFRNACLHHFAEYFDARGTAGTTPSWVVHLVLAPAEMGRDTGSAGAFVPPAPGTHGRPAPAPALATRRRLAAIGERAADGATPVDVAAAAAALYPGRQRYGNCGVQACQQIIRQATGENFSEKDLLSFAVTNGYALKSPNPAFHGETNARSRQGLLAAKGIASTVLDAPTKAQLSEALRAKKGIIAGLHGDTLWGKNPPEAGGHAVFITRGEFDAQGELTHVYLNDTGTSNPDFRQDRKLPADELMQALAAHTNEEGTNVSSLNVTDKPIWT